MLTSYSSCIKKRFKNNNKKVMKEKRVCRDFLLREIMREIAFADSAENDDRSANNDDVSPNSQNPASSIIDVIDCDIIYYILGCMVHSFRQKGKRAISSFFKTVLQW